MANFKRMKALDFFRGLTVVLMILVNCPGNQTPYPWLEHASWNGCTLADLVFPFFVFILGVSFEFSLQHWQKKQLTMTDKLTKIFSRSILLFVLGLFLNAFPTHFAWDHLRLLGVLQRLAICYLALAFICLFLNFRLQFILFAGLLLGYYWLLNTYSSPGFPRGDLTMAGNFAAYLDRLLLTTKHLYNPVYDPEGLLSNLPAIATAQLGAFTGQFFLRSPEQLSKTRFYLRVNAIFALYQYFIKKNDSSRLLGDYPFKIIVLFATGVLLLSLGELWSFIFPLNKALWTSSYVLFTGGLALIVFSFCVWLFDYKKLPTTVFFSFFGSNALFIYLFHLIGLKLQIVLKIKQGDEIINSKLFITNLLFPWFSAENAALLYAICYLFFCYFCSKIIVYSFGKKSLQLAAREVNAKIP